MTTIVLADDEALLRTALAALLPMEGDITVLAEAQDGADGCRSHPAAPDPTCWSSTWRCRAWTAWARSPRSGRTRPEQVILMLTRHARPGVLRKALKLGVQGFVSKSAEPAHISSVIATLHAGKRWIDPDVSALAVTEDNPLTDREADVLRVTGEGYSVADIAARLHLAPGTVRNYLSNAMRKTQTRTRHEAARYAREHDWL